MANSYWTIKGKQLLDCPVCMVACLRGLTYPPGFERHEQVSWFAEDQAPAGHSYTCTACGNILLFNRKLEEHHYGDRWIDEEPRQ